MQAHRAPGSSLAERLSSLRPNSFGFLRWVMAGMVVVDHSFPLGGFNGGTDPTWTWTKGQESLGGIAVAGFFVISGFLVCRSYLSSRSTPRFLWKRFLRIFPGFWVCLLVTAMVFAPLAWLHERGALTAHYLGGPDSPLHYVSANFFLHMHQFGIDRLLGQTPFARAGNPFAWDGSLWTLIYEFKSYLFLALLGFVGLLASRWVLPSLTGLLYVLALSWQIDPSWAGKLLPVLRDVYVARFGFLFLLGATLALFADRIPVNDKLGVLSGVVVVATLHDGGWIFLGYPAFAYLLLWLAARLPMQWWDRAGDLSYGTYIYAFPLQMLLAEHGLQRHGVLAFVAGSMLTTTAAAWVSWHLIEKRALALKSIPLPRLATRRRRAARTGTSAPATGEPAMAAHPDPVGARPATGAR